MRHRNTYIISLYFYSVATAACLADIPAAAAVVDLLLTKSNRRDFAAYATPTTGAVSTDINPACIYDIAAD